MKQPVLWNCTTAKLLKTTTASFTHPLKILEHIEDIQFDIE